MNQKGITQLLILGLICACLIAGLSFAYVKYVKPGKNENKNTSRVANVNLNSNTNTAINPCSLITDEVTCLSRADCLAVDACVSLTELRRLEKCGPLEEMPKLICEKSGFLYCEDFSCSQTNTNISTDETADWKTYENEKYNYSLKYPSTLYSLPNYGAPDTDKYFSNQNVGAPLEMDSNGIWITIRVSENENNISLSDWAAKTSSSLKGVIIADVKQLTINGYSAIQQIEDFRKVEGTESAYSIVTYIKYGEKIYSIQMVSFTIETNNNYKTVYETMASAFQFID